MHRLSRRARPSPRQRYSVKSKPLERGADLFPLSLEPGVHEGIQHFHGSICQVRDQRSSRSDDGSRRSQRTDLHDMPWESRCRTTGSRFGPECLLYLPCFPVPDVRKKLTQSSLSSGWPSWMCRMSQQSRNKPSYRRKAQHWYRRRMHAVPLPGGFLRSGESKNAK